MYDDEEDSYGYDDDRFDRNGVRVARHTDSKTSKAMKAAGYQRSHRWWLTADQFAQVKAIAEQNLEDVQRIKDRAHGRR